LKVGVGFDWKEQIVVTFRGGTVAIHSNGQTLFGVLHIEGITLGVGEELDKDAGGARDIDVDG
jgi:hypothetical protein